MRLGDKGIGLFSTLLLARLLTPADFGLVAMGTAILAILSAATEFGFSQALLQGKPDDLEAFDSAWTLNVLMGLVVAAALLAISPLAANFYHDSRVITVLAALALSTGISGARNVWTIEFEREMNFRPLFSIGMTKKICMVMAATTAAVLLRDYRALIIGMVAAAVAEVSMSFIIRKERAHFGLSKARSLLHFSKWWLLSQSSTVITRRGQDAMIGRRVGAFDLGAYSVAYELATLPTTELISPVMRAVFPGYLRMRDNPERLSAAFLRVWRICILVCLPASAGIWLLADQIVPVILGSKWQQAIPLLASLSLYGGLTTLSTCFWPVVLATQGPRSLAIISVVTMLVFMPVFGILLWWKGLDVAVTWMIVSGFLQVFAWIYVARRKLTLSIHELLLAAVRPVIGCVVMTLVLSAFLQQESVAAVSVGSLLASVTIGAVVYVGAVALSWILARRPAGAERDILQIALTWMKGRQKAA